MWILEDRTKVSLVYGCYQEPIKFDGLLLLPFTKSFSIGRVVVLLCAPLLGQTNYETDKRRERLLNR